MDTELTKCINWIYEDITKNFNPANGIPMQQPNIYRCPAVFKTGELSIIYVKSLDKKHIIGAIIISDSFSGTRGEISDSDFEFCQSLHTDIQINRN